MTLRLSVLALLLGPAVAAQPLQFVLEDADSRVTLYGSVHLLDAATEPLTARADSALAAAEVVALEVDTDDTAALADAYLRHAVYPDGRTLADALGKSRMAKLEALLESLGADPATFQAFRPWAVELALTGLAPESGRWRPGVDAAVLARAKARGVPVVALETADQQVAAFAAAGEAEQVASLMTAVRFWGRGRGTLGELIQSWAEGDEAALAEAVATMPPAVLRDRNAAWIPRIEALLAREHQDAFVVVGVGHLVGPDSVVAMLRARGYAVTQR